jgi:hypothetical protein
MCNSTRSGVPKAHRLPLPPLARTKVRRQKDKPVAAVMEPPAHTAKVQGAGEARLHASHGKPVAFVLADLAEGFGSRTPRRSESIACICGL